VTEVIVVIDRNSALEEDVKAAFPDIAVVANRGTKGLSGARNTGIELARGHILVFLDDDANAAPDCVAHLAKHVGHGGVVGVTTRVLPVWSSAQPDWFPDEFLWTVGCTHHEPVPGAVRNLLGAGMCLTRDVFAAVGGFDSSLGRTRALLPMGGEETELCMRASATMPGISFYFEPRALVYHAVTAQRATWKYFALRCFAEGMTKANLRFVLPAGSTLAVERSYLTSVLPHAIVRNAKCGMAGDFGALKRVIAIVLGLSCAAMGFACGLIIGFGSKGLSASKPSKLPADNQIPQETHGENV
jgi:GT2 family glycosyltransferase